MGPATFVVGTGRCGSTMLSNLLNAHPQVLSLSEFFSLITNGPGGIDPFSPAPIDGREFWSVVSAITPFTTFCLRNHVASPEWLYPFDSGAARFSRATGVPSILLTTLSLISPAPDVLFEELHDEVLRWPIRPKGEQYRCMFDWLAGRLGKRLWIERSGAALFWIGPLLAMFPDARFIHIVRDGRDAAMSMQQHPAFRVLFVKDALAEYLGVDPLKSSDRSRLSEVPDELRSFLPERFDLAAFSDHRPPLAFGGALWSQQIGIGLQALAGLPAERVLTMRYEDILAEPMAQLETFAAFLGEEFVDRAWLARCAADIGRPRSTWRNLPQADARALDEACAPGFALLREAGVRYD